MSKLLKPQEEFNKFLEAVDLLDLDQNSIQYKQLRKTFFSGMMCMLGILAFELPELENHDAEEELEAIFKVIKDSVNNF